MSGRAQGWLLVAVVLGVIFAAGTHTGGSTGGEAEDGG